MLSDAVLQAVATAAQANFVSAGSTCTCFSFHTVPGYKPATAWMTFTELDETDEGRTSGPTGLRGGMDIILAKYRLIGANPNATPTNGAMQVLTQQMRADKLIFVAMLKVATNVTIGNLALELGQKLHIASSRGGPYDVVDGIRLQLSWECTLSCRASLK